MTSIPPVFVLPLTGPRPKSGVLYNPHWYVVCRSFFSFLLPLLSTLLCKFIAFCVWIRFLCSSGRPGVSTCVTLGIGAKSPLGHVECFVSWESTLSCSSHLSKPLLCAMCASPLRGCCSPHEKAYSLYPRATFEERCSLIFLVRSTHHTEAYDKYAERTLLDGITEEDFSQFKFLHCSWRSICWFQTLDNPDSSGDWCPLLHGPYGDELLVTTIWWHWPETFPYVHVTPTAVLLHMSRIIIHFLYRRSGSFVSFINRVVLREKSAFLITFTVDLLIQYQQLLWWLCQNVRYRISQSYEIFYNGYPTRGTLTAVSETHNEQSREYEF